MSSEDSSGEIFSQSSNLSTEVNEDNVESIWQQLFQSLPTLSTVDDCQSVLQTIKTSLINHLKYVAVDNVQTKLLQYVMPTTFNLFKHCLLQISNNFKIENLINLSGIKQFLNISYEILKIVDDVLAHIISWNRINVIQIESLPKTVANILYEAYKHCKESEQIYGNDFKNLTEQLMGFFRKTSEVNTNFFILLNNVLIYELNGIDLLKQVIDTLTDVGEMVVYLDLKTMVEHWKGYTKLLQQNADQLKPNLNIAKPLKILSENIGDTLKQITSADTDNLQTLSRPLKVGSFVLKLVVRFCEMYPENLTDSLDILIDLIITLYEYSVPCLNLHNIPLNVIDAVESHIIVGVEPLFTIIFSNEKFPEYVFMKYETIIISDINKKISYIFLIVLVLKRFPELTDDGRDKWLVSDDTNKNIHHVVFKLISNSHVELCQNIKIPIRNDFGDLPSIVDLYEYILVYFVRATLVLDGSHFQNLEKIMLESILQRNVWRVVFASDLWCILGRYGTSELCYEQLMFLIEMYKKMSGSIDCPERVNLTILISRLYPLLSQRHQLQFFEKLCCMKSNTIQVSVLKAIGFQNIPDKYSLEIYEKLSQQLSDNITNFINKNINVDDFIKLCDIFLTMSTVSKINQSNKNFTGYWSMISSKILILWKKIDILQIQNFNFTINDQFNIFNYFFYCLCKITSRCITFYNNDEIILILSKLLNMVKQFLNCTIIKLSILFILKSCASKHFDNTPSQMTALNQISELFGKLLIDSNFVIKQQTFEIFDYFAHITPHDVIVTNTVSRDKNLKQEFINFIQKTAKCARVSYTDYLKLQQQSVLQKLNDMKINNTDLNLDVKEPAVKKQKININIESLIENIEQQVQIFTTNVNFEHLTQHHILKINKIIDSLNKFIIP